MPRTTTTTVNVTFGDCDPAGIVFFPNFSRWMDSASLAFFMQCGVPPWRELVKTRGIVGREVRAFVKRDEHDPDRLRAIPVPDDIRLLCS